MHKFQLYEKENKNSPANPEEIDGYNEFFRDNEKAEAEFSARFSLPDKKSFAAKTFFSFLHFLLMLHFFFQISSFALKWTCFFIGLQCFTNSIGIFEFEFEFFGI